MTDFRPWRGFDLLLLLNALGLLAFGVTMVHSATLQPLAPFESPPSEWVVRQVIYAGIGLVLFFVLANVDYHLYERHVALIYGVMLALLVAVLGIGTAMSGAQRWFDLGLFPLQPSELAKIVVILTLAKFLADREGVMRFVGPLLASALLAAIPAALVFLEPNLSTAAILMGVWLVMVLLAGANLLHIASAAMGLAALAPVAWYFLLHEYMKERLTIFLDPTAEPLGAGYNIQQALISIGSGGWFGQGLGQGAQSQLNFLRVQHTDYIFSVIGEELGFVGAGVLLLLFVLLFWRGLYASSRARDLYGQYIAVGVVALLFLQMFINIGMNIGVLPVTGIPLPFISYGGSSLISSLMLVGILESIVMHRQRLEF